MKILILHGIDSIAQSRRTSVHHAFFLPRHEPNHEYWLQAAQATIPPSLLRQKFDAVIIDTTFLCWRWTGDYFKKFKVKFDFIRDMNAVKIAFPQDEYDHSEVLENWLIDWKVDIVYSVCYSDFATFYPTLSQTAEIRFGYTGLFEASDIDLVSRFSSPWQDRTIDVGYRARRLPPYFGWFGKLKSDIADRFIEATTQRDVVTDISCLPEDALMGNNWLNFLGKCRFILGCESGSSVLDKRGAIKTACEAYMSRNPHANFEMVASKCFPGEDRSRPFTAISPRLFEAAAAGCGQILVPGHYSGVLEPWTHYLPLLADASNIDEILAAMKDVSLVREMIKSSRKVLLEDPRFTYRSYAQDVMSAILARRPEAKLDPGGEATDALLRLSLQTAERWSEDYKEGVSTLAIEKAAEFTDSVRAVVLTANRLSSRRVYAKRFLLGASDRIYIGLRRIAKLALRLVRHLFGRRKLSK